MTKKSYSLIEYCKQSISKDLKQKSEQELVQIAKTQKNKENSNAKLLLILKYLPKVKKEAKRIFNNKYFSNKDDIFQTAYEAILNAIEKFDENRETSSFASCVSLYIFSFFNKKKIKEDALLKVNQSSKFKEQFYKSNKSLNNLENNLEFDSSRYARNPDNFHKVIVNFEKNNIGKNEIKEEEIVSNKANPEEEISKFQEKIYLENKISYISKSLTKKQKKLLDLIQKNLPTKERIKILNISRQAENKLVNRIREKFTSNNVVNLKTQNSYLKRTGTERR